MKIDFTEDLNPCLYYKDFYEAYNNKEIDRDTWTLFNMACFEFLEIENKDLLIALGALKINEKNN